MIQVNKSLPIKTTELYPYYVPNLSLNQTPKSVTPSYPIRFQSQLECFPHFVSRSLGEGLNEAGKFKVQSSKEEYTELGIPEEWVDVLKQLGYTTIEKLKEVEKPGKLANDLNGYNKKNKLLPIIHGLVENRICTIP